MELHVITFRLEPNIYEAFLSLVEDERNENGIKVPAGQVVRKIVIARLREKGYLTDKPKAGQRRESEREIGQRRESGGEIERQGEIKPKQKSVQRQESDDKSLFGDDGGESERS
jgi:hypothetical protein